MLGCYKVKKRLGDLKKIGHGKYNPDFIDYINLMCGFRFSSNFIKIPGYPLRLFMKFEENRNYIIYIYMFPKDILNIIYSYNGEHKIFYEYNKREVIIEYKISYKMYICCNVCGIVPPDLYIRFRYEYSENDLQSYYCEYCMYNMFVQGARDLVPLFQKSFKISFNKFKRKALQVYGIGINYIYLIDHHRRHPVFINL